MYNTIDYKDGCYWKNLDMCEKVKVYPCGTSNSDYTLKSSVFSANNFFKLFTNENAGKRSLYEKLVARFSPLWSISFHDYSQNVIPDEDIPF